MARSSGLSREDVDRARAGADAPGWTPRQRALLGATDELHDRRELGDDAWAQLSAELSDTQMIELCMLVGHYEMLAMTLRSLRVQPERT
jgi:alkylhydroperoxidase family enzyme